MLVRRCRHGSCEKKRDKGSQEDTTLEIVERGATFVHNPMQQLPLPSSAVGIVGDDGTAGSAAPKRGAVEYAEPQI